MAKKITATQKQVMLTRLIKSKAGRAKIASSIQEPLRSLRDYEAVGRKAIMVDELADGDLAYYDKDPSTPAYIVSEEGNSIQRVVKGDRIFVPTLEIASYITIPYVGVKQKRYDVISRIKKKAKDELFRKEDNYIFSMMAVAGDANASPNAPINAAGTFATIPELADAFAGVEQHGLRVDKVYMNAKNFKSLRTAGRDYLDFETQRELLRTGFMGLLWGAQVWTSPEISASRVHIVTEPEFLGVMPVQLDLTVLPADDSVKRQFGWSLFESVGMSLYNAQKGLMTIQI